MKHFQTVKNIPANLKNAVIAIGNFDGVHLGHLALLNQARDMARELFRPFGIVTFEPHPRRLFRPDEAPSRITPHDIKIERLAESGADFTVSLDFDWNFASLSPENFVKQTLIDGLNAAHILIGRDFKFGQLRKGTPQTMMDMGLAVTAIDKVRGDGENENAYSSSTVRQLLRHGKIRQANEMLGWDWEIRGEVFKGDQRGRDLGYPTANIRLEDTIHPAYGIYAVFARIKGDKEWYMGAANIGIRPMFKVDIAQVETFIFDFDRDIYGKTIHVRPVCRLRGEAKFETLDALIEQMEQDCLQARQILQDHKIKNNEEPH